MGSESGPENEMPRHRVWVDSFGLGKFPVTNREYRIFVEAEQAPAPPFWSDAMFSEPEQPVVGVNWDEATAYCKWLSRRTGKNSVCPARPNGSGRREASLQARSTRGAISLPAIDPMPATI